MTTNSITRFAPSPTGFLHVGNIRTALMCYIITKKLGGKFMLRLDDTDLERSTKEFADAISEDLKWLGLEYDIIAKQSDRTDRYKQVVNELIESGRLYPCYETPEEIEMKRKTLLSRGKPPIYDRAALKLTEEEKQKFDNENKPKHWRFKLDNENGKEIIWNDLIKGETKFKAQFLSDPVLIRANGQPTYMLPSTIDDVDFDITHVVRGEDHVSNTAIQIQLFEAMGKKPPLFAHHSLVTTKSGKLSKRVGGNAIKELRNEENLEPITILSYLARLGTSKPIEMRENLQQIVDNFSLSDFGKSAAMYDREELIKFNRKAVHQLSFSQVKDRKEIKENNINEEFWNLVKENLDKFNEVKIWSDICNNDVDVKIEEEDKDLLNLAAKILPKDITKANISQVWQDWINNLKQETGRSGKNLFMPIRKALTGIEHGPEVKHILVILGYDKAIKRLTK